MPPLLYVAFYKSSGSLFDRLTRFWTRGPYSHVELAFPRTDGSYIFWSASPRDGGIRTRVMRPDLTHWDFYALPPHLSQKEHEAWAWFEQREHARYDYLGLLGFLVRPVYGDNARYFCSEAVALALGLDEGWRFSPNDLAAALRLAGARLIAR